MMDVARLLTLAGLFASGTTFWVQLVGLLALTKCMAESPTPCEAVIISSYGSPFGIPLPIIGLIGFGYTFWLLQDPEGRQSYALLVAAAAGAASGSALWVIQVSVLEQVCGLCLIADLAGIGLGPVIGLARLTGWGMDQYLAPVSRSLWLAAACMALILSVPAWLVVSLAC